MKKTYLLCLFAALLTTGLAQNTINTGKVSGHLAAMVTQYADNGDDKGNAATPKRIKPDVVVPGLNINAAYNSFYADFNAISKNLTYSFPYNGKTYYYLAESGTSMASPVVAGAIALWLQAKPDLTALKDGVYAVQLITDNPRTTGSTLIRL